MTALIAEQFTLQLNIKLRPAREDDLAKLEWFGQYVHYRQLFRETFEEHRRGIRMMLVADLNGFPIGQVYLRFFSYRKRGYLYALRVMEPFRGHKIGSRLIGAAEQIFVERRYEWAYISVAKTNSQARQLYERLGYVVYGESPGRWRYVDHRGRPHHVHEPAWTLRKRL